MRRKIMTLSVGRDESVINIIVGGKVVSSKTFRLGTGEGTDVAEIIESMAERIKKKYPVAISVPDERCVFKTVPALKRRQPTPEYLEEEFADYLKNGEKYRFEAMKLDYGKDRVFLAAAIKENDLEEIIGDIKSAGLRPVIITPERIALSELLRRSGKDGKQIFAGLYEKRLVMKLFDDYLCVASCEIDFDGKTPDKIAEETAEAVRYYAEKGMAETESRIIVYGETDMNSAVIKAFRQVGLSVVSVKSLIKPAMDIKTASLSACEIGAACL